MNLKKLGAALSVILLMVVAAPISASAATIAFTCLTNNTGSCSDFADTFTGTVTVSGNTLTAIVTNGGEGDGVITSLQVDAPGTGAGYSLTSIIENPDPLVNFSVESPGPLQGAGPTFTADFQIGADPPPTFNGANAGESVGLMFTLTTSLTDAQLQALLDSGQLRFGIHVQSLGPRDDSEGLVSTPGGPQTVIPEPATMLLLGSGLLVAARARRRKTT